MTNNSVDWLNLINGVYSKLNSSVRVRSEELVIVSDIEYYKSVLKLIESTPKRVVANYIGWAVSGLGSFTNQAFREANIEFGQVDSDDDSTYKDLWRDCVDNIESTLQYAISRLYIDTGFTKKDKDVVNYSNSKYRLSTIGYQF